LDGFAKGVMELWGFSVEGACFPPNFHRPLPAKVYVKPPEMQEHASWTSPTATATKNVEFLTKNVEFFVCLCACASVMLLNDRDCAHDFAMKALEYRNDFDIVR